MKARTLDNAISQAWLEAAKELGIRVTAPFTLHVSEVEAITYETHILDFGGPKGTVVGVLDDDLGDCRAVQEYYCSNLAPSYRSYKAATFYRYPERLGLVWTRSTSTVLVHR